MCAKSFTIIIIPFILIYSSCLEGASNDLTSKNVPSIALKKTRFTFSDSWLGKDKADHFLVSAFLVAGTYYVLREEQNLASNKAKTISISFSLSLGIAKEIRDGSQRGRAGSFQDLVADLLGIGAGLLLYCN